MKRLALTLAMVAVTAGVTAQTVTIDNAEDELLLYALVPTSEMPPPAQIRAALEAGEVPLRYVPPEAAVETDADGSSALLGVLFVPGRSTHPVVFSRLPDDGYLTVARTDRRAADDGTFVGVGSELLQPLLEGEPVVIDNDYMDWQAFEPVASFPTGYPPTGFEQTRSGLRRRRELSASLYWGKGGTGVEQVKLIASETYGYLMLETRDAITPGASYYLYGYDERAQDRASYTVEIAVTGPDSGFVFLWLPDRREPVIVGEFVYEPFFLEARLDFSRLPAEVPRSSAGSLSFDFSTAFTGARVSEEFFYTTLYARDIVFRSPTGM